MTQASEGSPTNILVVGDSTVDWLLAAPGGAGSAISLSYQWDVDVSPGIASIQGGAALLGDFLATVYSDRPDIRVVAPTIDAAAMREPGNKAETRTFSVWRQFPQSVATPKLPVWRVDRFLGRRVGESVSLHTLPATAPKLLLIDDANLGFRNDPASWEGILLGPPEAILFKMASTLGDGILWQTVMERGADRTTLYCSVNDLRKEHAAIGRSLSWERMAVDIVNAISGRPDLAQARRIIVSIGLSGAVLIEQGQSPKLIYDPQNQEGDWEARRPGIVTGLGTAIVSGLASTFLDSETSDNVIRGIKNGLAAARRLHELGFSSTDDDGFNILKPPVDELAATLLSGHGSDVFSEADIIQDQEWQLFTGAFGDNIREAARQMAILGERKAGGSAPIERMSAWMSADRSEIESMRSMRNIISEYLQQPKRGRPLNLAVFGPPGSGKSFGIKQMATELGHQGSPIKTIEFNLSQFRNFDELPAAFQRVRDGALEEVLPLVFWDEFDTALDGREMAWLARFLAPMQDGAFLENGTSRPIGPAIFVFAGGTHSTMESFRQRALELPGAKATDFLSRLRGFVNVLGPNPSVREQRIDETYVVRRALLLRTILKRRAPQIFDGDTMRIDAGVLRAFLDVSGYLHGARSMESIVEMSALAGNMTFVRSTLPAPHQLGLHVDPAEFLSMIHEVVADET